MDFERKTVNIKDIEPNKGQIEGLPINPRKIDKTKFDKLVKSIQENPEMLELREILVVEHINDKKETKYITIGGNMRLKALRSLNIKDVNVKIIKNASIEQLKAYLIKDNADFGEWDFEMLQTDWDVSKLDDWGIDVDWKFEEKKASIKETKKEDSSEVSDVDQFYIDVINNRVFKLGEDAYIIELNKDYTKGMLKEYETKTGNKPKEIK